MRGSEQGSALVQVLVMSVLLVILATGVLKVMYMNHTMVTKVQRADKYRAVAEACLAVKIPSWNGGSCASCSGGGCGCPTVNGMTVESITCSGGQANFNVVETTDW